jgi:hypothetical protein
MRPPRLGTLFALAACLTISLPALALSTPKVGEQRNGFNVTEERYLHVYVDCWDAFKTRCGRNIVDDQLSSGEAPSQGRVQRSIETMDRWLHPAPAPAIDSPTISTPAPAPVSVAPAPVGGSGCVGMEAESGSAGYNAVSPDGNYIGCYQIGMEHYDGGSCSGLSTDAAGQDACAAIICQTEGAGAWTNPAGQNPCGRLGG